MSIFNGEFRCSVCVFKETKKVEFNEDDFAKQIDWQCPNCLSMGRTVRRTVTIRKRTEEEISEEEMQKSSEPTVKRYKTMDGQQVEVDEKGNPVERSPTAPAIVKPRKNHPELKVGGGVVKLED